MRAVRALSCVALAAFVSAVQGEVPQAPVDPPAAAEARAEPWGLAPVRRRGLLAADLRSFRAEGQPQRYEQVASGQLQLSSYVWQPWFAQVEGGVGFVSSSGRGDSATSDAATLTGNGMLNLFPVSRFPFQASFDVSDSRASDQFTGQTYQTRRYGVRQSHRDAGGEATSSAAYDRSTIVSSTQGYDTLDVVSASHMRRHGAHVLDASGNFNRNERRQTGEHSQFTGLTGRHGWSDAALVSVDTTINYGASDQRLGPSGALIDSRNELLQLNTLAARRRGEDDPWSLTGGVRYLQAESRAGGESSTQSLAGNGDASYSYSRNLTLNASASAVQTSSAATPDTFFSTQTAGALYATDAVRLGDYLYSANGAVNLLNQRGGSARRSVVTGTVGHTLQRTVDLGEARSLGVTLAQSLSDAEDSVAGSLLTLNNSASVTWRLLRAESLAGFVSASASDARTRGYNESVFQLVNLQISGQGRASRYSTLLANLTVQGTRQETPQAPASDFDLNVNGGLTYQHARAFGVPQLRYLALYERHDFRLNTRQQGDLNAPREQVSESFEQRLEYRIGRLDVRLTVRFAEIDGRDNALVFFRIAREIGNG